MQSFSTSERFNVLDPKDRDRLDALSKLDQYAAGDEISSGDWLYLIMGGKVEMRAQRAHGELVVTTLGPGDLFGELEGFSQVSGVRHVAIEETVCWALAKNPLKQELRVHRTLAAGLLSVYSRSISEKLRAANEALASLPGDDPGLSRPPPPRMPTSEGVSRLNGPLGRPPHLTAEETGWLAMLGARRQAHAGELVVREGDAGRSFFVVEGGQLEVQKETGQGGEPRTLAQLASGDLFGFMAFVDKKPRSASVIAKTDCDLYEIEGGAMEKALNVNFTVSFKFLGTLCGVLGRSFRDTAHRVTMS